MAGLAADPIPPRRRAAAFVLLLAAYYAVYAYFFSLRLLEYFRDILMHFPFVRRYF